MYSKKSLLKIPFLYIAFTKSQIIKNINFPNCMNCIHYRPPIHSDFSSSLSECKYFGTKNIQTGKIDYDFVSFCRNDEEKCGLKGKYFQEDSNINFKIFLHNLVRFMPFSMGFFVLVLNAYIHELQQ